MRSSAARAARAASAVPSIPHKRFGGNENNDEVGVGVGNKVAPTPAGLPPRPTAAVLALAPGLPPKPTLAVEAAAAAAAVQRLRPRRSAMQLRGAGTGTGASSISPSTSAASPATQPTAPSIPDAPLPPAAKQYPATLSLTRQASMPALRPAGLPARPAFEQFPQLPRRSTEKGGRVVSPTDVGSKGAAAAAADGRGQAEAHGGSALVPVFDLADGPAAVPRKSSGGRSRAGKGRNRGKQGLKGGEAGAPAAAARGALPAVLGGGKTMDAAADAAAEDSARGRSDEPSPIAVYAAENVQSSSPAPMPGPEREERRSPQPPTPSPAGAAATITPHRPSAAQEIPRHGTGAPASAPPSPVPNSYQSLEDLLSQAGYRETRVFTPEAEKLRAQRREADKRGKGRSAAHAEAGRKDDGRAVMQAYPAADPTPAASVASPPFQDMAAFPDADASSPPVNGASWWNALALPWPPATTAAAAKPPPDNAVASLQHALRADHGQAAKAVRKMWSANDVSSRSTGFNWADESLDSIDLQPAMAGPRPEPARHWSDTAAQEGSGWHDGSPVKRKRKVLNRVDLEISLATTASTQSTVTTIDDSEQSVVWTVHSDAPTTDLSPTTQSDAGTIKPFKAALAPRMGSIGSVGGFDALAYESRQSGDFDELMQEMGTLSEAGSSLASSPERPVQHQTLKTPSPQSRKASPPRPLLKHAASVPVLPCSGTAEWDIMLASLPPLPPVPFTAADKPALKRIGKPAAPPRALRAILSAPKQPASPMLVRSGHIVCDSNQAEDLPPLASRAEPLVQAQPLSMMRTLRNVMSLSALRYRKQEVAAVAAPDHSRNPSVALTLTPKPGLASDAQEWVPTATPSARRHGFNVLYNRHANSPKYNYTDNVDEVEAANAAAEHDYLRKEPDFTQSFFYQPPTPPRLPGDANDGASGRREAKRQRSIKSLRAHLLKKTVVMASGAQQHTSIPAVPALPLGLQKSQPQRIEDRRHPPPPVFAISSPGATEAGLPPRELLLEGEEWDAGSLEGIKQREASGLVHGKRLTKRPSLEMKRSGERRA